MNSAPENPDHVPPILAGWARILCTGNGTHKPAQLAIVRMIQEDDGDTPRMCMGEGGGSWNIQNSRGLDGERKMQPALWPLQAEDPTPGVSTKSYRFVCDRCARDVRINEQKLEKAITMMVNHGVRNLDISHLPFA